MSESRQPKIPLETHLGLLAMRYRSTRDEAERERIVADYRQVVEKLIARKSKKWEDMPAFEDMLPDERMPEAFFTFWSIPVPHHPHGRRETEVG